MTTPPATAVIRCGATRRTRAEVDARAERIAGGLHALGLRAGDRVGVVLGNSVEYVEVYAATRLLGTPLVPVNRHGTAAEVAYLLADSGAAAVFTSTDLLPVVEPSRLPIVEVADGAPSGRHAEFEGWLAGQQPWTEPPPPPRFGLLYSSGTTGRPKGVQRDVPTPAAFRESLLGYAGALGMAPGMSTLIPGPLYHSAPGGQLAVAFGMSLDIVIMARFDPAELLRLVAEHRIAHTQLVPTMFVRLLALPSEVRRAADLSSLRCAVHAAAPCPVHVKRAMIQWWGPVIREYYGGAETGAVTACDAMDWLAHPGTVGRPWSDAAIRILDEDGRQLPPGTTGFVYARPPSSLPGFTYRGRDGDRARIERDGFLHIGDIGHLDADGYLFLTDRAVDLVIRGGVNIYPAEIEATLLELPGVRDAAVVGVPDPEYGEVLAAHVDVEPSAGLTADTVRAHVRTRLAAFKVPRDVVFDADLPRDESGKLVKRRIRDRYRR